MRLHALLLCLLPLPAVAAATDWLVVSDYWGNPVYQPLHLEEQDGKLGGVFDGDLLSGERHGRTLRYSVTDTRGARYSFEARLQGDTLSGRADVPDPNDAQRRVTHAFTARRLPERPAGPPRTVDYAPTSWSNEFSPHRAPVLTVWPGDTIRTKTIDSGGVDERGVTVALFGNPQTGPFYIAGAAPGDTLAVTIRRLHLNRDYADSLDMIVGRAQSVRLAAKATELGKPVRWTLDRERGVGYPQKADGKLKHFEVPLRPMLGGLAVAPGFGSAPISTGDTGNFGGNMDFNEIVEGNTVYLPVQQPGALLYVGDAHALQGDGETTQYALETSMDVELTVDLIKGKPIPMPRVESPTQIMTLGQAGSLDEALRQATAGLVLWLQQDYGLSLSECAQVLGTSVQYSVPNLAGRSVGVAAKIDKARLTGIPDASPPAS
ncbi:acetamidase/formamidase family protein [Solimonas variicoloris]|uniref:acetamidase/formamidase family protein n=1 Tax=Solimonas variicoloris TaxID=254408 RepID=UPI00036F4C32|nr:acetamidase/formamidase family protein [Solimonas variicoloris]